MQDAGRVSHELAIQKAGKQFDAYKKIEAKSEGNGFDELASHVVKIAKQKKANKPSAKKRKNKI